jgi:hypothetical protein
MSPEYIVAGGEQGSVESTETLRAGWHPRQVTSSWNRTKGRATYDAGRFALYQVGSA